MSPRSVSAGLRPRRGPAIVLALIAAYAVLWPLLASSGMRESNYDTARTAPGWPHVMGTDTLGFDVSVQVAEALRVSLVVALGAALVATVLGLAVGTAAASLGGRADRLLMRVTDAVASVPHLLAAIVVVAMFRGSVTAILIALALTHWPTVARVVRAETQAVLASEYVACSRVAGASSTQIVRHHVLSAVAPQTALAVTMLVPHAIWHESTLSFLGIGLRPEQASLGTLIATSRAGLLTGQWWPLVFPSIFLVVLTLALSSLYAKRTRRASAPPALVEAEQAGSEEPSDEAPGVRDSGHRAALRLEHVSVRRSRGEQTTLACDDISFAVAAGEVAALVGESGAGKSTLVAACCGLVPRDARVEGRIVAGDVVVDPHRPGSASAQVGHVPQDVSDAFTPTRRLRGQIEEVHRRHDGARALAELCELVHLDENLLERFPHQLSGGQLARAALVAALASEPRVLVADEPTAGLDPELASQLLAVLRGIADDAGVAVLVVTHEIDAVLSGDLVDRVAVLRDGVLVAHTEPAALAAETSDDYLRALTATAARVGQEER